MYRIRKVCDLPKGRAEYRQLWATDEGNPVIHTSRGVYGIPRRINRADAEAVETWQRKPENDCLRARGDAKWQAASAFLQHR